MLDAAPGAMLIGIPHDGVDAVWPGIVERIRIACARSSGRFRADDILKSLLARDMQLWLAGRGSDVIAVAVTEIIVYPGLKACRVMMASGEDHPEWVGFIEDIGEWARQQGCGLIEAGVRRAYLRMMPHFHETHILIERAL